MRIKKLFLVFSLVLALAVSLCGSALAVTDDNPLTQQQDLSAEFANLGFTAPDAEYPSDYIVVNLNGTNYLFFVSSFDNLIFVPRGEMFYSVGTSSGTVYSLAMAQDGSYYPAQIRQDGTVRISDTSLGADGENIIDTITIYYPSQYYVSVLNNSFLEDTSISWDIYIAVIIACLFGIFTAVLIRRR